MEPRDLVGVIRGIGVADLEEGRSLQYIAEDVLHLLIRGEHLFNDANMGCICLTL